MFLLLFLKSNLANHSLAWAWFLWSSFTVIANFYHWLWDHKSLSKVDLLLFYGERFYGFSVSDLWKPWKKKYSFHNKRIYIIYRSQTFWCFMKFYFVRIVKVCFVFKKTVIMLRFLSLYSHKTLPTIGNKK